MDCFSNIPLFEIRTSLFFIIRVFFAVCYVHLKIACRKKSLQLSFLSPQILDWFFSRSAPILSIDPVHTDSLWIYEHVQLLRMICRSCCSYGRPRKICDGSLPMLDGRCLAGGTPSRSCTLGTILQYSTRGANTVSYCLFDHNAIHRLVTTR